MINNVVTLVEPIRVLDATLPTFWIGVLVVQVVSIVGYAASSLPAWAKWEDGSILDKLTILRGTLASLVASNVAFGVGYYHLFLPEILCWVSAAVGGYAGDAFLSPLIGKFVALVSPKEK